MEVQIPKAKYSLSIEFFTDKTILRKGSIELEFKVTRKQFKDMVYYGYLPEPLQISEDEVAYLFDNHEDFAETLETIILLLAFKESIGDWGEFKKYADIVKNLSYIALLFWYSRVVEYKQKGEIDRVIKAFKELYL